MSPELGVAKSVESVHQEFTQNVAGKDQILHPPRRCHPWRSQRLNIQINPEQTRPQCLRFLIVLEFFYRGQKVGQSQ